MSPVRATVLQLSLDLQLRTLQLSRYARSKRTSTTACATARTWLAAAALEPEACLAAAAAGEQGLAAAVTMLRSSMLLASACTAAAVAGIPLKNAADPGVVMPVCGLGTGVRRRRLFEPSHPSAACPPAWA